MRLPNRQGRHQFWERVRGGLAWWEAAADAGISQRTAERWFRQAGGIMPPNVPALSSQRCLSLSEREEIFAGVERGDSIRAIAMIMGAGHQPCIENCGATCAIRSTELAISMADPGRNPGTIDPAWLKH